MSAQAATEFLEKVANDDALRETLLSQGGDRKHKVTAMVNAGRERGFQFTADEVTGVLKARAGTDAALGERELAAVTGGSLRTILGRVWAWMGGPTNGDGDGGGSNAVAGVRG
jgi:predicted ribosomally synthesized peptide with nif11-like leader